MGGVSLGAGRGCHYPGCCWIIPGVTGLRLWILHKPGAFYRWPSEVITTLRGERGGGGWAIMIFRPCGDKWRGWNVPRFIIFKYIVTNSLLRPDHKSRDNGGPSITRNISDWLDIRLLMANEARCVVMCTLSRSLAPSRDTWHVVTRVKAPDHGECHCGVHPPICHPSPVQARATASSWRESQTRGIYLGPGMTRGYFALNKKKLQSHIFLQSHRPGWG